MNVSRLTIRKHSGLPVLQDLVEFLTKLLVAWVTEQVILPALCMEMLGGGDFFFFLSKKKEKIRVGVIINRKKTSGVHRDSTLVSSYLNDHHHFLQDMTSNSSGRFTQVGQRTQSLWFFFFFYQHLQIASY